ncbi:hypothetical protein [Nocardia sp. NPDC019302]|uniref:hypothetical protein n=1 Tax=Nocardia sp. NPDC019302 TaxID=3154592 RepID=UPI0033D62723
MNLNDLPWFVQALIGTAIGYPLAAAVCWVGERVLSRVDRWLFPPNPVVADLFRPTSLEDIVFTRRALAAAMTRDTDEEKS